MKLSARDIPIVKLIPRYERKVKKKDYDRIAASIRAVGLIEPLVVCPEGDGFEILNGHVRYQILLEMGVESIPCLVRKEKDGYTNNRMVSHLSPIQETRMIRKSLDELDEETIANALAMTVSNRMHTSLLKELHPRVAKAFDAGTITKACARELTFVKPKRQDAILNVMEPRRRAEGDSSPGAGWSAAEIAACARIRSRLVLRRPSFFWVMEEGVALFRR